MRDGNALHSVHIVNKFPRNTLYGRLEEHDYSVAALAFSDDGHLLATVGSPDDGQMVLWDMSTGHIVSIVARMPVPCNCVCFGGFVRDVKRRDTSHYQLATAGSNDVTFWDLHPYTGMSTTRVAVYEYVCMRAMQGSCSPRKPVQKPVGAPFAR
jgi:WD40 repeat protein